MPHGKSISGRIKGVIIGRNDFTLVFPNERKRKVAYWHYPRLSQAKYEDLLNVSISGGGRILHWETLDEDIAVEHILAGKYPVKDSDHASV